MPQADKSPNKEGLNVDALYPELTEEQRREAAYYLSRYLDVVQRIFERVHGLTGPDKPNNL